MSLHNYSSIILFTSKKVSTTAQNKAVRGRPNCLNTEPEPNEDDIKWEKFIRRRDIALSTIFLTINYSCSSTVIKLRDPYAIWKKLQQLFEKVSEARIDSYLVEFQSLKMPGFEKAMDFVNRLILIENKLAAVGHAIPVEKKRRVFLRGIRDEFSVAVQVIRSTGVSFEKAVADLVIFEVEAIMTNRIKYEDEANALSVSVKPRCGICGNPVPRGVTPHTTNSCFFNPNGNNYKPDFVKRRNQRGIDGYNRDVGNDVSDVRTTPNSQQQAARDSLAYMDFSFVMNCMRNESKSVHGASDKWFID